MVEIFGRVERNVIEDGEQITVFRIPAFSRSFAERRANTNISLKGLEGANIQSIEQVGTGDIPRQKIYDVTVVTPR